MESAAPIRRGSTELEVGPLSRGDQTAAMRLLARAFRDNPLNVAVLDGRSAKARYRANLHGMRALLPTANRHGIVLVGKRRAKLAGVLISAPPYAYPFPLAPAAARFRAAMGQGFAVARRWRRVFEAMDAVHPVDGHWYLGTLGVDPRVQGQGVGRELLGRWLADVDAKSDRAYLETDRSENLPLYEGVGFHVVRTLEVLGVRVYLMARSSRRRADDR